MAFTQQDVILLITDGAQGPHGLDPVRMMKGCVIAAERGEEAWRGLFAFEPYDWGPFDIAVYRARDALVGGGLLDVDRRYRYERYSVGHNGQSRVRDLEHEDPNRAAWLRSIGEYVSSVSFGQLLREIYEAFPEYATRSRFQH